MNEKMATGNRSRRASGEKRRGDGGAAMALTQIAQSDAFAFGVTYADLNPVSRRWPN
jgi:hypothetical protein